MRGFFVTVGSLAGWMMSAFVLGVAAHMPFLYAFLSPQTWLVILPGLVIGASVIFCCTRKRFRHPRVGGDPSEVRMVSRLREDDGRGAMSLVATVLILLSFLFGIARCDLFSFPRLRRIDNRSFLAKNKSSSPTMLEQWRGIVTARIESALPHQEATLVTGILYGDQDLSKQQRDLFRRAGLLHIVAVSGSNVTIVVQFLALLIAHLGLKRRHAFFVTSFALIAFCGFVGFSASVVRAAMMGWLILFAHEVGRIARPSRLLLVAATMLLIWNPWQLFYDMGFALSFLAMWGLLVWTPIFEARLSWLPNTFEVRKTLAMTLGATLMTAPYLVWAFQYLSLAGLITNVFVLPLVSFLMGWGALTAIWGNGAGAFFVNAPALGLARLIEIIAGVVRYTPWLEFSFDKISLPTIGVVYFFLAYIWTKLRRKNRLSTARREK